jgi:predicted kinase
VIVDATFRRRAERDAFREALVDAPGCALFVECRAPAGVLAARAQRRARDPARVSDADADVVERQRGEFESLDEVDPAGHLTVRGDRPLAGLVDDVAAFLDRRLAGGPW